MTILISVYGTPLSNWYDEVMPHLRGVTAQDQIVIHAIREAAILYLRLTKSYEADHDAIDVVAGTSGYTLTPGPDLVPVNVVRASYNGENLTGASESDLDSILGEDWRTTPDTPTHYYLSNEETIELAPEPSASLTGGLVVRLALTLGPEATTIPAVFWTSPRHRNAIAAAALASMYESPNKPYSDPVMAQAKWGEFNHAVGAQSAAIAVGRTRAPLRTRVVHGIE